MVYYVMQVGHKAQLLELMSILGVTQMVLSRPCSLTAMQSLGLSNHWSSLVISIHWSLWRSLCAAGDGQSTAASVDVHYDDHTSCAVHALWAQSKTQPEGAQPSVTGWLWDHDCCRSVLCQAGHTRRYIASSSSCPPSPPPPPPPPPVFLLLLLPLLLVLLLLLLLLLFVSHDTCQLPIWAVCWHSRDRGPSRQCLYPQAWCPALSLLVCAWPWLAVSGLPIAAGVHIATTLPSTYLCCQPHPVRKPVLTRSCTHMQGTGSVWFGSHRLTLLLVC